MWQPPDRIKHVRPAAQWPTAEEAAASPLFTPIALAMVPWRATDEGFVTPAVIDWYRRFAEGRPGVIVVEATGIRDVPSGPLLRIGHDRFVPGLRQLTRRGARGVGRHALVFIQLIDFLSIKRRPPRDKFLERFLEIDEGLRARDRAATLGDRLHAHGGIRGARARSSGSTRRAARAALAPRPRVDGDGLSRARDRRAPAARRGAPSRPARSVRGCRRARRRSGLRRRRAPLRARVHDGVVPLAHEHARPTATAARSRGRLRLPLEVSRLCVRAWPATSSSVRASSATRSSTVARTCSRRARSAVALASAGLDFLSISKGGRFEDAAQPKVGHAAYPYTGLTSACRP